MNDLEIKAIIVEAAEAGAKKALAEVGLHDDTAGVDVRELRGLLDSWRETKKTITQTIARTITTAILGALALGTWYTYWSKSK